MGKVVRTVAVAAVGIGIAIAAPYVGAALFPAIAGSVSTAIAAAVMGAVAGMATKALGLTARVSPPWSEVRAWPPGATIVSPANKPMRPIQPRGWRGLDPTIWGRFYLVRFKGDCMFDVPDGSFGLIDRSAELRPGDLVVLEQSGDEHVDRLEGMGKRFEGYDPVAGQIEYSCDKPKLRLCTPTSGVPYAHRVRALGKSRIEIVRAWWTIRRNPAALQGRLAARKGGTQ